MEKAISEKLSIDQDKVEDLIHDLKNYDPLSKAEEITGESIHDPKSLAAGLGMLMQMQKGKKLNELYDSIDDTNFSNTVPEYLRKVKKAGFEVVYTEDFRYTPDYGRERKEQQEKLYILWNAELAIMIIFDTFYGNVNACNMYYNYSPNDLYNSHGCTSSGHYYFPKDQKRNEGHIGLFEADMITPYKIPNYPQCPELIDQDWKDYRAICNSIEQEQRRLLTESFKSGKRIMYSGYHDGREGVISTINRMLKFGKFFTTWVDCPYTWITHFAEHKGENKYPFTAHYEATRQRMAKLPKEVQERLAEYKQD